MTTFYIRQALLGLLLTLLAWPALAQIPTAPTLFKANAVSPTQIDLVWTHPGTGVDKFVIQRSTDNRTFTALVDKAAADRAHSNTGLLPNTSYYYRIYASFRNILSSTYASVEAKTDNPTLAVPTELAVSGKTHNSISVQWNPVSGAEGYEIRLSSSNLFLSGVVTNATTASNRVISTFTDLQPNTTYFIQVRTKNTVNGTTYWSSWSGSLSATTDSLIPAVPTGLEATDKASTAITVKWNAVSGADLYQVRLSDVSNFSTGVVAAFKSTLNHTFTGLTPNRTYYIQVQAKKTVNGIDYWSGWSMSGVFQTDRLSPPGAPTLVTAVAKSPTQVEITWKDNSSNEDKFRISFSPQATGPWSTVAILDANAVIFTKTGNGIEPNTSYYFQVCALNDGGESCAVSGRVTTPAVTTTPTPPAAPTYTLIVLSNTQIQVNYQNNAGTNLTALDLQYSVDQSFATNLQGQNVSLTGSSVVIGSLQPNTKYYFRLRASNSTTVLASDWVLKDATTQPTAATKPAAPINLALSGSADARQINVAWTDVSNNETGFDSQYADNEAFANATTATVTAGVQTFSITNLQPCKTYFVRVSAKNSAGNSDWLTGKLELKPALPGKPTSLAGSAASTTQINLTWAYTANTEDIFELEYADNSGYTNSTKRAVDKGARTESVTGLRAGATYSFRLKAQNCAGDQGWAETTVAIVETPQPPAAPTNLVATAASAAQINLTWTDNSDETVFEIERSADGTTGWANVGTTAANTTTFQNTGLATSTQYFYRVRATRASLNSGYSNTANATTAAQTVDLATPTNLRFATGTPVLNQLMLLWDDVATNETGYEVWRSVTDQTNWVRIAELAVNTTTYTNPGLRSGERYYYRVRAVQNTLSTIWSNIVSETAPLVNATTGASTEVRMYPNPVSSTLYISGLPGTATVNVLTSTGIVVLEETLRPSQNQQSIDIQSLQTGLYMVIITTHQERIVSRILKR